MTQIGTLAEKSLHAALKEWIAQPGDQFEVMVDNFVIDIVRGDLLIEIQTGNFSAMKRKLGQLLDSHPVHLLHPIPREKWIVRQTASGNQISRRKSPKRGRVENIFDELVYIPHLISHPNLSLEVLFTQEEQILRDDGKGSWRRKRWSIHDQRLLNVAERAVFKSVADFRDLLPPTLPQPFTNADLAESLPCPTRLAQKMTYTLRESGVITLVGKQKRALLYEVPVENGAVACFSGL